MSDRVTITISDGVADVRFNRPEKMNALDLEQFAAIAEAGEQVKADPSVRAVVISGEGRAFCAGLDISVMTSLGDGGADAEPADRDPADGARPARGLSTRDEGRITNLGQQVAYAWHEMPAPVIAAVHGVAFGGGIQIALGADIRFVAPDARLSVMEIKWGIIPDMTGIPMLSRLVSADVAKELALTGRIISGEEAATLGLATHVSEHPLDDALALAREIAGKNPGAVRAIKQLVNDAPTRSLADSFLEESRLISSLIGTPNQLEAVMAELEKRPAKFVDG